MSAYGRVWGAPYVRWLLLAALLGRLPYGITGLAIVLFVHEQTGSFASAGAVSAAGALGAAAGTPALGRVIDRTRQSAVLAASGTLHATGIGLLVVLGLQGAPLPALAGTALVAGACTPPLSPALRGLWSDLLDQDAERIRTALALDAITLELVFTSGPLLVAVVVLVGSAAAALGLAGACAAGGALAFAAAPPSRRWRGRPRIGGLWGPLVAPGMRTLLLASLPVGLVFGAAEVALPAFGAEQGSAGFGGLALAALSVGSVAGGLWYGARPRRGVVRTYLVLLAVLPAGIALLALPASLAAMLLLAPLAGAVVAPLTAAENELVGHVAPEGTVTEAYAWIITALVVGVAAGSALGGLAVEGLGWRAALLLAAAVAAAGAAATGVRRRTLLPAA